MEAVDPRNSVPPGVAGPFFGFLTLVTAVALAVSAGPLLGLPARLPDLPTACWAMALLAVACDARPFLPPGRRRTSAVFPSTCFTFAILLGWGLGPAVAVQAVAVLVSGVRMRHPAWRTAFNAAQYACALAAAYLVLRLGPGELFAAGRLTWAEVGAVAGAAGAWFTVNYVLVNTALRLRFGGRWWPRARQGLPFEALSTGSLLLLAPILVTAARASALLVPLVLGPLFAVHRMTRLTAEQEHLAALDPLTGLPNRKALLAEVAEQVHRHSERVARGNPRPHLALLLIDLDRFKNVNDALGHAVGDRLLVEVSARLVEVLDGRALVARLGGDEFAIVAGGLSGVREARDLADRVVAALAEPVRMDGLLLDAGGSIGIALFPGHGEDYATLMRHADVAMYEAKHRNDTVAVYAPESDHHSAERLALLADLRRVLEAGTPAGQQVRGGDGAALPTRLSDDPPADGAVRWRPRRRRPADPLPASDELLHRILTGADPTRRRSGAPADPPPLPDAPTPDPTGPATATGPVGPATARGPVRSATASGPTGPAASGSTPPGQGGTDPGKVDPAAVDPATTVTGSTAPGPATPGPTTADPAESAGGVGPGGGAGPSGEGEPVGRPPVPRGDPEVGRITMYYQPQVAIDTGEVVGVEALLRWRHPRRGMVNPEELIRVAEQTAVMRLLTRRVVEDVLEQLAKWSAAGVELRAALNVSVRDLHSGEVADQVAEGLTRYGIPPQRLQVEVTEGALMADPRRVLDTITRLHHTGVAISLDDFGTGYSSLQHLRRLPLSEVKVDRSFVLGMAEQGDDAAIVRSMIDLAGALGLRVVAEGVEDERTWRLLHAAGCDVAQGWFHARPMPAEELTTWLARYRPLRPTVGAESEVPRRRTP